MKFIGCLLVLFNIYIGGRFMLNVLQLLHTSKYSKTATFIYAILFLAMGLAGAYFIWIKKNYQLGFYIGFSPWLLALLFLLFNMLTSDYK